MCIILCKYDQVTFYVIVNTKKLIWRNTLVRFCDSIYKIFRVHIGLEVVSTKCCVHAGIEVVSTKCWCNHVQKQYLQYTVHVQTGL